MRSEECHSCVLKLNEIGSLHMKAGKLENAICVLTKALRLMRQSRDPDVPTHCHARSLDLCLEYSDKMHWSKSKFEFLFEENTSPSAHSPAESAFIFQHPIQIHPQLIESEHCVAPVLQLILTFNLALAHHLTVLKSKEACTFTRRKNSSTQNVAQLREILRLYQCVYRYHMKLEQGRQHAIKQQPNRDNIPTDSKTTISSLRLSMILCNNIGQIHYIVNDMTKYKRCLQYLLSTIMFFVDRRRLDGTQSGNHDVDDDSLLATEQKDPSELKGYFCNATCLILSTQAAAAA